ncbi:MAG: transglycosylase SLT domain-containing protein [Flavicella sp.]
MNYSFLLFILSSLFVSHSFAQQPAKNDLNIANDSLSFVKAGKDSIANTTAAKTPKVIDSIWLQTLYSSPLHDTTDLDTVSVENTNFITSIETAVLKERLQKLNETTPFNLEYNPELERMIKSYLKHRAKYYPKMLARARYYFPMFEKYLDAYDIPLEIKYLAVVESALYPRAKSPVGATGIWQFMYATGKQFGLNISSYVDERQDPVKSAIAACQFLQQLYKTFDDWDLALAAYNSGPGNVTKAIRRSGGYRNYWNIRPFLPRETAGYLPAFYATLYIFEYAKEHNIHTEVPQQFFFETDTIQVRQLLTFDLIQKELGVRKELLEFLNPEYKLNIIPYVKGRNYSLRLPASKVSDFVERETDIYALATEKEAAREKPLPKYFEMNQRIRYRVKSGDYLGKIANKYGVRVSSIKKWNGMKSTNLSIGQRLIIYPKRI